jgi:hypothetical protein
MSLTYREAVHWGNPLEYDEEFVKLRRLRRSGSESPKKSSWRDHRGPGLLEFREMRITGDEKIGGGSTRQGNEIIIARIGRDSNRHLRIGLNGAQTAKQANEHSNLVRSHVGSELGTHENPFKLL